MQGVKADGNGGMAAFGLIIWVCLNNVYELIIKIVVGVVYPVVLAIIVNVVDKKLLFKAPFQGKFSPYYGTIGFKRMFLVILPFARLFLVGSIIGFLVDYPIAQLVIISCVFLAYALSVLFFFFTRSGILSLY